MKTYFKITGPGISYFPLDADEIPKIIEWLNGETNCILLKKGLISKKTPFCIVEDYDRKNQWNIIIDKRADKMMMPPQREEMTDSMKEIRQIIKEKNFLLENK